MQAVDNLLRNYGKDREWLAVLVGYEPDKLNKILSSDKTTYGQLQNMLRRGGIELKITIQGETEPGEGADRMQFLKNNIRMHRNTSEYIRKVMKRGNIPEAWYEQDDIPMSDLVDMEKNFRFKLLYHFKGMNVCGEDVMKTEPLKKNSCTGTLSPYIIKKFEYFQGIAKKNGVGSRNDDIDVPAEMTAEGFNHPEDNRKETIPTYVRTKNLKFNKDQYEQISVRASKEGKTIIDFMTDVLENAELIENADYVKMDLPKDYVYKNLTKLSNDAHQRLNEIVSITELDRENVVWCIFNDALKSLESLEPEIPGQKPAPVAEEPVQTTTEEETKPEPASAVERERSKEPETKTQTSHGGRTFMNWVKGLGVEGEDLLTKEFRIAGREELTDGRYGVDTINALKPFRYPEDRTLMELSAKLKADVKAGRLLFVTTEEGDWQTKSLVMKNQTLTEQYTLYKEIISRLSACYTNEAVKVRDEILTTDGIPVLSFSIVKQSEDTTRLIFGTEKKRFLSTKKESFTALPGMLHPVQWYQLADLAEKHFFANNKIRIQETIANSAGAVREKRRTFAKVLDRSVTEVILETSGSGLTDGFLFQDPNGTLWSEPAVRGGKAVFRHTTDNGDENVEVDNIPLETLDRLFNAVSDHICKQLTN